MMNSTLPTLVIFLLTTAGVVCDTLCESPQYLERGKTGIVNCQFPEPYYGVFWYNTTLVSDRDPIAYVTNSSERGGIGYESNEYNIAENGSLVITEVSLKDDKNFTVVVLKSIRELFSENYITVIVTVKPFQIQPYIDGCNTEEQVCFKQVNDTSELSCNVKDARPSVDLNWYIRTIAEDKLLNSKIRVSFNNSLYTTLVQTTYVPDKNENVVYICKSDSYPSLLKNDYSLLLVQNQNFRQLEIIKPTPIYARRSNTVNLLCIGQPTLYLLWKKTGPTNRTENLIHMLSTNNDRFVTNIHSDKYTLTNQTSLGIGEVDVIDEGFYSCTFGDGISESVKKYNLQVYVMPDPETPIVEGCTVTGPCTLTLPKTGELSCSLKGIRPKVELRWETVSSYEGRFITFSTVAHKAEENGLIYDITLKSHFHVQDSYSRHIYIRCRAFNFDDIPFDLSREVLLFQLKGNESEEAASTSDNGSERWKLAFLSFLVFPLFGIAAVFFVYYVKRGRRTHKGTDEEMQRLRQGPSEETIRQFKEELKTKYRDTWERICPLPYNKNVTYAINDIFVEGEIEHLEKTFDETFGHWKKLKSHNDFLNTLWKKQAQIVLEGEPGFGKTTLGYQFANGWATKNPQSPLKDTDIYILLRLRYLKDVLSIPGAIREFLLPGGSPLTVEDVKSILYHSRSVVIFLDGYNRFSYDKDSQMTFMDDIRTNNICPNCRVIVTTKTFCLPDDSAVNVDRMRLSGFGEACWREYLKKSVVGNDTVEQNRIMEILHNNPLLRDLCQVPLFFAMFAHITKNRGDFRSDFNTVTSFFQILIDGFHSKVGIERNEDKALSSICFEGLLNKEKSLIWEKSEICTRLGHNLYKAYLSAGLLVEKKFCKYKKHGTANSGNVTYETKVRFFHDVFCEWYAAKKLVQVFETASEEESRQYLDKINRFDHQYVYRFACAFNSGSATKIIKCMQSMQDGEKFATILCILEQPEHFTKVEDTIGQICSSPVNITSHDNLVLQRSTVQLLKFASDNEINIVCVWLGKTNSFFDDGKESLEMASGIFLPKLPTLQQLSIHEPYRKLSKEELIGFLKYMSLCDSLNNLTFRACMVPFLKPEDCDSIKNVIGNKTVEVQWELPVHERFWYTLDIESGEWRHKDTIMSEQKYSKVVQSFNMSFKEGTTEDSCDNL